MIAEIVITMTVLGFFSLWQTRSRYSLIITMLCTGITGILFFAFINSWLNGQTESFFVLWDASLSGDIRLNINSSLRNYRMVFPFFSITLFSLINNLTFRFETQKKNISAFICLNFAALTMLITAGNFIQLITFVFVIDILSQLFIQDINAGRRYAIYNLVADMGLFLAFALLRGGLENLTISRLTSVNVPHHDFAALIILISLFIKLGFFVFHTCFLDLKSARFHRLIMLFYLSSPAAALILFVKLFGFLSEFTAFLPIVNTAVVLTVAWGAMGAVIMNNLKEKLVYFNMMLISLLIKIASLPDFVWNSKFSFVIINSFLINICFYYLHYYISRKNNLVGSSEIRPCNPVPFIGVSLLWIMAVSVLGMLLGSYCNAVSRIWLGGFAFAFLLGSSHTLRQVYRLVKPKFLKVKFDRSPLLVLFGALVALSLIARFEQNNWRFGAAGITFFVLLLLIFPFRCFDKDDSFCNRLQSIDIFPHLYNALFVKPMKAIGKTLAVFVDFMFFEKTLLMLSNLLSDITIRTFRKVSRLNAICYLLFTALSLVICAWFIIRRNG